LKAIVAYESLGDNQGTELSVKRVNSITALLFVGQNEQKQWKRFRSLDKTCNNNRSVFGLWVQQITKTKSLLSSGKNERSVFGRWANRIITTEACLVVG